MANGYIGKISAVVTANTSDLSAKLRGSVKEVNTFANSLNSSIKAASRSATESLARIFTPLQQFERKLQTALQLNIRTDKEVAQLQSLKSVVEGINKPLEAASRQLASLSAQIGGAFLPALTSTQDKVLLVNRAISDTGRVSAKAFGIAEQSVARTAAAIQRLSEAQRLVSSGPQADSLAFVDPRTAQALQASAAIRQQASQLPASALADGRVARQVGNLSAVDNRVAEARARIESIQARPRVDATELAAARKELDRLLAGAERIRAGIRVRLDAQKAIADASELKQALDAIRSQQQFGATGRFQNIEQAKQSLQEAIALQDRLTAGQRSALQPGTSAAIDAVESAGTTGNFNAAQDAINRIKQSAEAGISLNIQSDEAQKAANDLAATIGRLKEDAEFVITGRPQNFNQVQSELSAIIATLDKLSPAGRGGVSADITAVIDLIGQEDLAGATAALDALRRKAGSAIEVKVEADAATDRIASLQSTWDRALSGIPSTAKEIDAEFQSLASRIANLKIADRVGLEKLVQGFQDSVRAGEPLIAQYQKLLALSSAVGKIDGRGIGRTGDVARGAFGNTTLAIQQATFAIDDFFSVTGGLDQRIRAAGNNISQLGFVLGGTEGLILGVSAAITAQLLVSFSRWVNDTDAVEARTKALNAGLSRQKSAVEALAQAYRSLADEIERSGSGADERSRRAVSNRQRADEIRRLAAESNREDVAAFSPEVAQIRAERGALERRLEAESDVGRRLRLQAEIDRSRRREQSAIDRGIPLPTQDDVGRGLVAAEQARVSQIEVRLRRAQLRERLGGAAPPGEDTATLRQSLAAARRDLDGRRRDGAATSASEQLVQLRAVLGGLESQRASVQALRARGESVRTTEIDAAIDEVVVQIRRIETALSPEVQRAARSVNEAALSIANRLEDTAALASEAGASAIQSQAVALGEALADATRRLAESTSPEQVRQVQAQIAQLDALTASLRQAAETVNIFAEVLNRTSNQLAETVAQEARSVADQARRDANRAEAELAAGGPRNADGTRRLPGELEARAGRAADTRREAERAARQAEETRDRVRRQNDLALQLFERDVLAGQGPEETRQLLLERQRLQQQIDRGEGTEEDRRAAQRRIDQINQRVARQFEDTPEGRAATARADRADQAAQRAQEQLRQEQAFQASADRGDAIRQTPAQRAAQELAQQFDDIRASFGRQAEEGTGLVDVRGQNQALQRAFEDQARAAAPAIFTLADSVANAVLQGPSRAALNVTDVSSVEGARELNRLLRGDDPARDQNLVELQKQNQSLSELVRLARENGVPIAN